MRYEFFRALSALRFKSALSAYEPTMLKDVIDIAVFPSFILMLIVSNIYSSFQNRNTIVIVCIQIFGNNIYYYYVCRYY